MFADLAAGRSAFGGLAAGVRTHLKRGCGFFVCAAALHGFIYHAFLLANALDQGKRSGFLLFDDKYLRLQVVLEQRNLRHCSPRPVSGKAMTITRPWIRESKSCPQASQWQCSWARACAEA